MTRRHLMPTPVEAIILIVVGGVIALMVASLIWWSDANRDAAEERCAHHGMIAVESRGEWFCVKGVEP